MALADSASCAKPNEDFPFPEIIELNVGGQVYITRHPTLVSVPGSLLWEMFTQKNIRSLARDSKGRFFVDRDGFLFRYILDYMRDQQLVLPDHFPERSRLQREAEYFMLPELVKMLAPKLSKQNSIGDDPCQSDPEELSPNADATRNLASASVTVTSAVAGAPGGSVTASVGAAGTEIRRSGFITIGYRGSYTLGRDSQTDAKFRRVARIMVCGKTSLAKEVFGDTLNESRDPDRPPERYTSRYYLKFTFLEQAFDKLADAGFHMVACNSTGTCAFAHDQTDDKIWTSYTEYVFYLNSTPEAPGEPKQCQETKQDSAGLSSGYDFATTDTSKPGPALATGEKLPSTGPPSEGEDPSPADSLPWPEAPEEFPPCPNTLNLSKSFKKLEEVKQMGQRSNSDDSNVKENGVGGGPEAAAMSEERKALASELGKCIEDFRKIKIPAAFPNKKRQWQSELLKKYHL
ncbi:BTB/POZ domain-containing protein KCTD12-like isoform X3 [Apteryx mantelli]|uniref:BTB/POZ domain-containing protein KCTD12-like isoform X3 n=1 Tax=Apteryx mantelli TaxID=2696672 RepID=A0ABM4F6B7_9AVES